MINVKPVSALSQAIHHWKLFTRNPCTYNETQKAKMDSKCVICPCSGHLHILCDLEISCLVSFEGKASLNSQWMNVCLNFSSQDNEIVWLILMTSKACIRTHHSFIILRLSVAPRSTPNFLFLSCKSRRRETFASIRPDTGKKIYFHIYRLKKPLENWTNLYFFIFFPFRVDFCYKQWAARYHFTIIQVDWSFN